MKNFNDCYFYFWAVMKFLYHRKIILNLKNILYLWIFCRNRLIEIFDSIRLVEVLFPLLSMAFTQMFCRNRLLEIVWLDSTCGGPIPSALDGFYLCIKLSTTPASIFYLISCIKWSTTPASIFYLIFCNNGQRRLHRFFTKWNKFIVLFEFFFYW